VEIVKILRLLNLEDHRTQLCGYWDVGAQGHLDIEAGTVTRSGITRVDAMNLKELDVRSGPFGSRTAVFVEQSDGDQRTMLKASWVEEPLRLHEWTMLCGLQNLGEELLYAPEPIGLVEITTPGFQTRTSEVLLESSPAPHFAPLVVSALATKQYLGDLIGSQVPLSHLVHIHMQLAQQILILAKHGYHYRDLNEANIRLLRGSEKTLLIIDFGNMRKNLSPRGSSGLTDVEALIDRATDDTQCANPLFLPRCCYELKSAIKHWRELLDLVPEELHGALNTEASDGQQCRLSEVSRDLKNLRKVLKRIFVHSHRYIDDLESAAYLHFWRVSKATPLLARSESTQVDPLPPLSCSICFLPLQTAHYYGLDKRAQARVVASLDLEKALWSSESGWRWVSSTSTLTP
jgi:hypothetical protein